MATKSAVTLENLTRPKFPVGIPTARFLSGALLELVNVPLRYKIDGAVLPSCQ